MNQWELIIFIKCESLIDSCELIISDMWAEWLTLIDSMRVNVVDTSLSKWNKCYKVTKETFTPLKMKNSWQLLDKFLAWDLAQKFQLVITVLTKFKWELNWNLSFFECFLALWFQSLKLVMMIHVIFTKIKAAGLRTLIFATFICCS